MGLKDLLVKRRVYFIRKELERRAETNLRITWEDFVELCGSFGLTHREAERAVGMLEGGMFLVQSKSLNGDANGNVLFLKPKVLIDELLRKVDPDCKLLFAEKVKLDALEEECANMDQEYQVLVRRAERWATLHVWGLVGTLAAKYSFFAYLVYSDSPLSLGWDIMEPVTYLYGIFLGNLAVIYIIIFGVNFHVPTWVHNVAKRRLKKLCEREGFDLERFERLKLEIAELKTQLEPPEAFVLAPPIETNDFEDAFEGCKVLEPATGTCTPEPAR